MGRYPECLFAPRLVSLEHRSRPVHRTDPHSDALSLVCPQGGLPLPVRERKARQRVGDADCEALSGATEQNQSNNWLLPDTILNKILSGF